MAGKAIVRKEGCTSREAHKRRDAACDWTDRQAEGWQAGRWWAGEPAMGKRTGDGQASCTAEPVTPVAAPKLGHMCAKARRVNYRARMLKASFPLVCKSVFY